MMALMLLASSASARRLMPGEERQISGGDAPAWSLEPVKQDTRKAKAFCGLSHNMTSEGEARADALRSAREQIVDAIGTAGIHILKQVSTSAGSIAGILDPAVVQDNALRLVSEGQVATRAQTFHIEKWQRMGESGLEHYFKAFVLVLWDNQQAAESIRQSVMGAALQNEDAEVQTNINRALERMQELRSENW